MSKEALVQRCAPVARGLWLRALAGGFSAGHSGSNPGGDSARPKPVFVVEGVLPAATAASEAVIACALTDLGATADATLASAFASALAASGEGVAGLSSASDEHGIPSFLVVTSGEERVALYADYDLESAMAKAASGAADGLAAPKPTKGAASSVADGRAAGGRSEVVRGRVACVTGGAQGFGEEIVRGLAASGAFVFIADMNAEGASRLAASLNEAAGSKVAAPIAVDVASEDSVAAMVATIVKTAGGLDLLVSNAGVLRASSVLDQDLASFRFVTEVNYTAFMLVVKYAGKAMRAQNKAAAGHWTTDIVQINSKSGLQGSNRNGSYAGSKFGSIGLVQSFALELVEYGIKVNAICPGNFFDGPLWSDPQRGLFVQYLQAGKVPGATTIADVKAFYEAKVPMRRGCTGPDVMRAIYYLVEQEYETGQALPVTGGQVMLA
jgi:sorbitol-6-phosphate 2-dehydrogenase